MANGQVEATNKIIVAILHKTCEVERKDWEEQIPTVAWEYRTMYKATTGNTPFHLMYGQEVTMPMEHIVPSLWVAIQNRLGDEESLKERLYTLLKLNERRKLAQWST